MDWRRIERERAVHYRIAEKEFFKALMEQLSPVINEALRMGDISVETVAQLIREEPVYKKFEYVYQTTGSAFAGKVYGQFQEGNLRMTFDAYMANYVQQNAGFKITSITDVTKADARKIISDVVAENANDGAGELGRKISRALKEKGGKIAQWRSRMIARTEVATASNIGMQAGAEQTGLPMVKVWLHSGGKDARISHEAMNGQEADIEGYFIMDDGTRMYTPHDTSAPPEHVINCRCGLTYKVRPDLNYGRNQI